MNENETYIPTNKKRNRILLLGIMGVVVFVAGMILYNQLFFFARSSSPRNKSTVTSSIQRAIITFNKPLDPAQNLYDGIQIEPQTRIYRQISIDNNKIIIEYASLDIDKIYAITFKTIRAQNGKTINNFTYQLRTKYVEFDQLSKEQQDAAISEVDRGNTEDPVLSVVPYETLTYTIRPVYRSSDEGGSELTLNIEVFLTNADRDNVAGVRLKYRRAARAYLQSKGIDLSRYVITYSERSTISAPTR